MQPSSRTTVQGLERRVDELERRRELTQADVSAQMERTLATLQDLVTATENLRRRVEALERAHAAPGP